MAKARPINQYDLEGRFVRRFDTARKAADSVGLSSHSGIVLCCQQHPSSIQTAGFQWRYADEIASSGDSCIEPVRDRGEVFKQRHGVGSDGHAGITKKRIQTSLEKYGTSHPMKNECVKQSLKETSRRLYGFDNPAQNPDTKRKISTTERRVKSESFFSLFEGRLEFIELSPGDLIIFRSLDCGHKFEINRQLLSVRNRNGSTICTSCNPIETGKTSEIERELGRMIDFTQIEKNVTGLVQSRHEIDIFLPELNLGIEVNGIKFHSDQYGKGEHYHLNKTKMFADVGIQILHFFDDEVSQKMDLVIDMIKSKSGLNKSIYARNCSVRRIDNPSDFLNSNHLQGSVHSSIAYGLFYEDKLVSCMTFGGLRKSLGYSKKEGTWEMLRFCNLLGHVVVGGASRLLRHFILDHDPERIISYANLRWSNGNMYTKIGFKEDGRTNPGYFYFWKNRRVHRYFLRKSELVKMGFDPKKTEREIIDELGVPKIYDCGNIRFVWER
jgi:very-short-patch-repair endonuclease